MRVCKCLKRTEVRATALAGMRTGKSRIFATVRARRVQIVEARGHKELASLCMCMWGCGVVSTVLAKTAFDTSADFPPLLKPNVRTRGKAPHSSLQEWRPLSVDRHSAQLVALAPMRLGTTRKGAGQLSMPPFLSPSWS